jgi:hypothetical protein
MLVRARARHVISATTDCFGAFQSMSRVRFLRFGDKNIARTRRDCDAVQEYARIGKK